jgi:2,3-bisphosphoglycerate-independent phosphoglycerate mutase
VVLVVLDGWGLGRPGPANALSMADLPNMTGWMKRYPHTRLVAQGESVGLPSGITGNSEVGHMNLGAGYVFSQDVVRIHQSIADKTFFSNTALVEACTHARNTNRNLHLMTMIGPSQVHSAIEHLWAMLALAQEQKVTPTYVHLFSDGRDSSPTWLAKNAAAIEKKVSVLGGKVVSVTGRYYGMDRDQRWDRTERAYELLTARKGVPATSLELAARNSYAKEVTDEFIEPTVIANGKAIELGDSVVFLNFRTDRTRQLTAALNDPAFLGFTRVTPVSKLHFVTMTEYSKDLPVSGVAFGPLAVEMPLARVISEAGMTQLHASETEKVAHVTYFFNGGHEGPFVGEDDLHIPSPNVATYDLQPGMSAPALTDAVIAQIRLHSYDFMLLNYANADMVAHTGVIPATIEAVEVVDAQLGRLWKAIEQAGGVMVITADHGNAEVLRKPDGSVDTEHNPSDVPLLVVGTHLPGTLAAGALSNVSPTILPLLDLPQPPQMTATSLWRT